MTVSWINAMGYRQMMFVDIKSRLLKDVRNNMGFVYKCL